MIATLGRRNNWWISGEMVEGAIYYVARDELYEVLDCLDERRIQLIVGPRRVGKSTIMLQAINFLLNEGIDPKRILFFSCDDPNVFDGKTSIGDVIESYANDVLHESFSGLSDRVFIFIDEIHKHDEWQLWLKSYYDSGYNIKFVVSGSSASHLFDGSKESLLGRTDIMRLLPLGYIQFCKFWAAYKNDDKISKYIDAIPDLYFYEEPIEYCHALIEKSYIWDEYKPYANAVLQEFLLIGGYPEYFSDNGVKLWQKRLVDDIIGQGLYRDVVSIHKIKSPEKLEKLLFFISDNNGKDFNMKTIADTIGCDNETVTSYLKYLSQAYMTIVLENYSTNIGKTLRKNKKLFVMDNGIVNAMLRLNEIDDTRAGQLVENICARDALAAGEKNFWSLYYWRDKQYEVDIVLDRKIDMIPIEVKYRNEARTTNISHFQRTFAGKKILLSITITKDLLSIEENNINVPFRLVR